MIGEFNYPAPPVIFTTTNEAFVHYQARENSQSFRNTDFGFKIAYSPTSKHISEIFLILCMYLIHKLLFRFFWFFILDKVKPKNGWIEPIQPYLGDQKCSTEQSSSSFLLFVTLEGFE